MIFVFLNIENTTHTKKRCACTPHMGNRGARAREATRRIPYLRVVFFSFSPHPPNHSHLVAFLIDESGRCRLSRGEINPRDDTTPEAVLPRAFCPSVDPRRFDFLSSSPPQFFFVADAVLPDKHGTSISRAPSTHLARRQRSARVPLKDGASPL